MTDINPAYPPEHHKAADVEKGHSQVVIKGLTDSPDGQVHRNLKARHLQMIAIGGTIGTGLFLGIGGAYADGGPLGLLLGYSVMGSIVFAMMVTLYPVSGAFTHYASRFVDPALGFALGWNYWYSYAITLPTEISAAVLVIDFWPHGASVNSSAWITILLVSICSINFFGVRWYGEAEFWFALIKVILIIGLIITGIIISAGATPSHETIGFRFWHQDAFIQLNGIPGAKGRFLSFWATFVQAAFSYLGTEIVALAAGEAENPRRNVPKAIRRVFGRILLFYVGGVFVIGLIVSPTNPQLLHGSGSAASPWVIAIKNAGIKVLPSIVNAAILSSAFSAGNSDLYAASRTLYGLACDGKAPAIFRKCTKNGLPIYCLIVTALFGLLAFMTVSSSASTVFSWLSNLSSITGLITWGIILLSYLRFYYGLKRAGIDRNEFPFRAPFQPWLSIYGLCFIILIIFFSGFSLFLSNSWNTSDFFCDYITVLIFAVLYVFWKLWHKSQFVRLDNMDFETGRRELDAMSDEEALRHHEPTTFIGKVWDSLM